VRCERCNEHPAALGTPACISCLAEKIGPHALVDIAQREAYEAAASACETRADELMALSRAEPNRMKAHRHFGEAMAAAECMAIVRALAGKAAT
jgi:hypothetical protein